MHRCPLIRGHHYRLERLGSPKATWQVGHPRFGAPRALTGIFCGEVQQVVGTRTWYCFEIRVVTEDGGMIFIPNADLDHLTVTDLTEAPRADRPRRSRLRKR